MRHILTVGSLAFASLWFSTAARATDFTNYYADDFVSGEDLSESPDERPLLYGDENSFGCDFCSERDCYDCCDSFNGRRRILGMLPSDHCFDRFVSPLSNPFYFEDPRSLTEVRGIFLNNTLPPNIGGINAQVYAAQFRGRVTDRISVIVPRVGYIQVNDVPGSGGGPTGLLSSPIGFKYNWIRDVERQFLLTAGMTYFIPGSEEGQSNLGGGDFHFFLTGGKEILGRGHWISASGFRIPVDGFFGTQMWYWSNQWDYELPYDIFPLLGVNWFHFMSSAGAPTGLPFTSLDLINLPANGVAGTNVVSGVVGMRWKPSPHFSLGTGFEFPLTTRRDILRNRVYADLIFRY